jgi:hypothetical protein
MGAGPQQELTLVLGPARAGDELGVPVVTVERDWRPARDWLAGQLGGGDG